MCDFHAFPSFSSFGVLLQTIIIFTFRLFCTVKFYTLDDSVMFVLRRLEDHTHYSAHSTHSNTAHSSRHNSCPTSPSAYSPPHGNNHSVLHQHRAYGQNIVLLNTVRSPTAAAVAREASHNLDHNDVHDVRDVPRAEQDIRKTSVGGEMDSVANGTQQLHVSLSEPANLYASCLEKVSSKLYHFYHFFICVVFNAGMHMLLVK